MMNLPQAASPAIRRAPPAGPARNRYADLLRVCAISSHATRQAVRTNRTGGGPALEVRRSPGSPVSISEGRVASSRGGVLIRDEDGNLVGSIGVSGTVRRTTMLAPWPESRATA
jgi:Haem-degrading